MPTDPQDRLIDALIGVTTVQVSLKASIESLDKEIAHQRGDISNMAEAMGNLAADIKSLTGALNSDRNERKKHEERKQKAEDEEKTHKRELEKERAITKNTIVTEAWAIFKQPLAWMLTALMVYIGYRYGIPVSQGSRDPVIPNLPTISVERNDKPTPNP